MLTKAFVPLLILTAVLFAGAPILIALAPYESTMGLVQKIFYFHFPVWMVMFLSIFICGIASIRFLVTRRPASNHLAIAAGELVLVFGLIGLLTGPLWARKAWGVWWQWDARLTSALVLWMIFAAYALLRRFGGPGSERLAAGVAVFGMANVPFVYWSVNVWRTIHPKTTVVPTLDASMRPALYWSLAAFMILYFTLLAARVRLEQQRASLDEAYLAAEEA
ncbi:MAG TPA: cytochrome c biogenesis protein CcsA [Vicinamibacterales bacterium]